ncbi:uncharacterized protein LOC111039680 [Myzus persicae]|uniref:uncharacterized protein LOC111039680 n=1 Tax=Myzus persicae TaxID=13164 RepID=UPI000B9333C2|nr:uncharacterized protein LOC111039680 [Myzus persicae]
MASVRHTLKPPQPATLSEMGSIITSPLFPQLMNVEGSNEPFFQGNLEHVSEVGDVIFDGLVFANRQFIERNINFFRATRVLGIDGTFQVFPSHLTCIAQLAIVYIIVDDMFIPIVYAFLKLKNVAAYKRLWQFVRHELNINLCWEELTVEIDFDIALWNGINIVSPGCRLLGSHFHFTQSIVRFIQSYQLRGTLENLDVIRVVRLIMALPYLPHNNTDGLPLDFNIRSGFEEIVEFATSLGVKNIIQILFDYVERYWLDTIGTIQLSVYKAEIRTNYFIESLHSIIRTSIGINPPCWTIYDQLKYVENRVRRESTQILTGHRIYRSMIICRDRNQSILKEAWRLVRSNRITLMDFLHRASLTNASYLESQLGPLPVVPEIPEPHILLSQLPSAVHLEAPQRGLGEIEHHRRVARVQGVIQDRQFIQELSVDNIPRAQQEMPINNSDIEQVPLLITNNEQNITIELNENVQDEAAGESILNCSVCLEDMQDVVTFRPCYHQFCLACTIQLIANWITTCPLCRTGVTQYYIDL